MLDKNQIIHDIVMLHLKKTFDFSAPTGDEASLAIDYEMKFGVVKDQLIDFNPED
ncbi:hypothetical protein [Clostridium kluyveri]|uniref:hypothetical protein n=1 Tax=Clostridium kluyveri TaxID=1534 RepID=UPI0012ECA4B2|nr:hypothetical protein [Clostridium kluyveri]